MKTSPAKIPTIFLSFGLLLCCLFLTSSGIAQTKYQSTGGVKIIIEGTSNIHDWDMKSDKGTCAGVFDISNSGSLTGMSVLNFSVPAESLKSEHTSMDNNTYKALNTKKYSSINFTAASATVKSDGSGYILTAKGKLTISGVTKDVVLTAKGVVNADMSITYTGSYQLKMTDYNVQPPSIMFGAIKTGNNLVVKFNLLLKSI
ncbi:MAG: YceI family protein [Ginsengibacter sp.]